MSTDSIERVPDPLTDEFTLHELTRVAPWVYEQIMAVGVEVIAAGGVDIETAHPMREWVAAISKLQPDVWKALAQG